MGSGRKAHGLIEGLNHEFAELRSVRRLVRHGSVVSAPGLYILGFEIRPWPQAKDLTRGRTDHCMLQTRKHRILKVLALTVSEFA